MTYANTFSFRNNYMAVHDLLDVRVMERRRIREENEAAT